VGGKIKFIGPLIAGVDRERCINNRFAAQLREIPIFNKLTLPRANEFGSVANLLDIRGIFSCPAKSFVSRLVFSLELCSAWARQHKRELTLLDYLMPLGGVSVQPCIFTPNQPEPHNCGGAY
jgi:hypothetical protein